MVWVLILAVVALGLTLFSVIEKVALRAELKETKKKLESTEYLLELNTDHGLED